MTEAHRAQENPSELDVLDVLRALYRWKWFIMAATLIAGAAAAVVSMSKPDVYASSAALIVREPQSAIQPNPDAPIVPSEPPVLSVEALQMLAESTETMRHLFDTLWDGKKLNSWKYDALDKESVFPGFQHGLSSEVKRQQSRRSGTSIELLPILILNARSTEPDDAKIIANEWASIVKTKSGAMYTQDIAATDQYVGDMYRQSSESLAKLEKDLALKSLEAGAELRKARLTTYFDKIAELEGAILDLDIELAVNAVEISEGTRRIQEQEYEGEWIGSVAESVNALDETYPFDSDTLSERARRILALARQKTAQMTALRAYQLEQNFVAKQGKFKHLELDMARILADKAKAEDDLPAAEENLAALVDALETLPETLTLDKAITDDALWDAAVNNPDAEVAKLGMLKTEILNPVYVATREQIIEQTARIETLRGNTVQLAKSAEAAAIDIESLASEIDRIQREVDRRQNALKDTEAALALLREDYLGEIKRVEEFKSSSMRKEAEKKSREARMAAFENESRSIEETLSFDKLEVDRLTREVEKTKNVRSAIASKAEETALLQVTAENATRTGTSVLWQAEADPTSLKIGGSKVVLASMITVLLLCSVIVGAIRVLRLQG